MKIVREGALPVGGESGLLDIRDRGIVPTGHQRGQTVDGTVLDYDIWPAYVDRVLSFVDVEEIPASAS